MENATPLPKLRCLVVDDSAYNRQTITAMLEALPEVEVIARAMNGKEALKLAFDQQPDVITLDLEMPEMDGFAFLRLLMQKRPTPVIVVSGYAQRENVFKALELGALDFVAKPGRDVSPDLRSIEEELARKIDLVRRLQAVRLRDRARSLAAHAPTTESVVRRVADARREIRIAKRLPIGILGIASSTGGPPAVQQLLCSLPTDIPLGIMISQHMPARFTKAFAERLDRIVPYEVVEASDGLRLHAGMVVVAPGSSNMEVELTSHDGPVIRVVPPSSPKPGAPKPITPSGDHMFRSIAAAFGPRFCALVLTGMGSDGREGARMAKDQGAFVLAEDPQTAVMPGMPFSVVEAGIAHEVHPLEQLGVAIERFVKDCLAGRA